MKKQLSPEKIIYLRAIIRRTGKRRTKKKQLNRIIKGTTGYYELLKNEEMTYIPDALDIAYRFYPFIH